MNYIQNHQVKNRCLELFSLASTAFLRCVGLLHQTLRSSTFTLASIFVVLQLAPQFLFEKKTPGWMSHQWKNPTEGPGPTTSRHRQVWHEIPDLSRGDVVERIFDRCRKKQKKRVVRHSF